MAFLYIFFNRCLFLFNSVHYFLSFPFFFVLVYTNPGRTFSFLSSCWQCHIFCRYIFLYKWLFGNSIIFEEHEKGFWGFDKVHEKRFYWHSRIGSLSLHTLNSSVFVCDIFQWFCLEVSKVSLQRLPIMFKVRVKVQKKLISNI